MGFQSIFAQKALLEPGFSKRAVIDAHRSKHEYLASGLPHRNARRSFLKGRESGQSGTSNDPYFEHAAASAAA
jgi:hypothetical protein